MNEKITKILFCRCGKQIPTERAELGYSVCIACAEKNYTKPKGVMIWGHKTGADIQILSNEQFANFRKYNPYGHNTGRGSGLHRITKTTSSL